MMFRFKALQKMREPDELDSPSLLASPRGWIAVFVIMFVMAGAIVWAFVGSIPVSVGSSGLLTYAEGSTVVASPYAGSVRTVAVTAGKRVEEGAVLASVTTTGGAQPLRAPFAGNVIAVSVTQAQLVNRGTPVVTIERVRSASEPIVGMLFVSAASAGSLRPGLGVELSVASAPSARFGLLKGRISSVGQYALSTPQVAALVGGDLAARPYAAVAAPHLVIVSLDRDAASTSGYRWTTASGPPAPLRSQVPISAMITVADQSPIDLLFGR